MEEKKQTEPVLEPLGSAQEVEQAIEAILFAAGHPMRYDKLAEVLSLTVKDVRAMVREIGKKFEAEDTFRGIQLLQYPNWQPRKSTPPTSAKRSASAGAETFPLPRWKRWRWSPTISP